jgi:3-deoxy-manno-octulosonate cytidylyltransferase (CMP-KDO synthetase)
MKILAIIPARMGSSRFPGKPLASIKGKPMIGHVYENVSKSELITKVVVATCDQEIFDYIASIGGECVMTSPKHERASDRCAEALTKLENVDGVSYDIVVMVQGDEPMINSAMISEAVAPLIADANINISNLIGEINSVSEFLDPNCIKVVCDKNMDAMYFSRQPIPTRCKTDDVPMGKQICVIPFRRQFLIDYTGLQPTPLEIIESIDMLRVLENGLKVRMIKTLHQTQSVDTPDDLAKVEKILNC